MRGRLRLVLIVAAAVAALSPAASAGAALRSRVAEVQAFGAPAGLATTFHVPTRRPRAPQGRIRRGTSNQFAPIVVPGESLGPRVGRVGIVVLDARRAAKRRAR